MEGKEKKRLILAQLIFLTAFPALATDMYLPALPTLAENLTAPVAVVNLTLALFFVFFGASMIIWGTLSDKYGRRPMLLVGTAIYVLASLLCAFAGDVYQLIVFRIIQAIGSGAAVTVSMACMKDIFQDKERERALAISNILFALAPVIAPVIGALILKVATWRSIFHILMGFGVVGFVNCLFMDESAPMTEGKSLIKTLGNLGKVLKNPGFFYPLLLFSSLSFPMMLFLGSSSSIYIIGFGLSEQKYSLFFSANAVFMALGPVLFLVLSRHISSFKILKYGFIIVFLGGCFMVLLGNRNPFFFAASVLPALIATQMLRPPSVNILFEQGRDDAGAASSLMSFTGLFFGGMMAFFISLDWNNRILVYGIVNIAVGLLCSAFWPRVWKKCSMG